MQGIDHARVGRSGRRNDHDRNGPRGAIICNGLEQRLGIHPAVAVGSHQPQSAAADAGLMRNFQPCDVAIAGSIKFCRSGECSRTLAGEARMRRRQGTD